MEPILSNAPPPIKKEVELYMLIDSDHVGDKQIRISPNIICNNSKILFFQF